MYDADTKKKIVEEYRNGTSVYELAIKYDIHEGTIYKWAREGIREDNRARTKETKAKVIESHRNGHTVLEIAQEFGISPNKVYFWLRGCGITKFNTIHTKNLDRSQQVAEDYRNGESIDGLSEKYGVSTHTVYAYLRQEKIFVRKSPNRYFSPAEIYIDYLNGMSMEDISEKHGVSQSTVQNLIRTIRCTNNPTLIEYSDLLNDIKFKLDTILSQQEDLKVRLSRLEGEQ